MSHDDNKADSDAADTQELPVENLTTLATDDLQNQLNGLHEVFRDGKGWSAAERRVRYTVELEATNMVDPATMNSEYLSKLFKEHPEARMIMEQISNYRSMMEAAIAQIDRGHTKS